VSDVTLLLAPEFRRPTPDPGGMQSLALVVLTDRQDPVTLHAAQEQRAGALIWKTPGFETHLRAALLAVLQGKKYFPHEVAAAMARMRTAPDAFTKILSDAEQRVIELFATGATTKEMARQLDCAPTTVRRHLQNVRLKIDARSRRQIDEWARKTGYKNENIAGGDDTASHVTSPF
jgi:DNA-binding NarL/FixJ family response regulator